MRALRARFVYVGKGAFIHPRATVEASIVGDGVQIGAHAYVNGAVLGAGTIVEERAHVVQSTLGPNTFVSRNSVLSACAVFGDTDACVNGMQGCVVAEQCGLTSFAHPLDIAPGGTVNVDDAGTLRDVGELPCGVAFGAGVFLGAGVYVAPGRAVPAGVRLVGDPGTTLRRITAADEGAFGTVVDGAVRRL
jgi:NDP-sugar pyrophosphorylase family protein